MLWTLLLSASAQTVTGGVGVGGYVGLNALQRPGFNATASIEVAQLTEHVPWFGIGATAELGFRPRYRCTTCPITGAARIGLGPMFKRRAGSVMVGVRASAVGPLRAARPFLLSRGRLPATGIDLRPYVWAEGLTGTEVGVGLEIGFRIDDKGVPVFVDKPEDDVPEVDEGEDAEKSDEAETNAEEGAVTPG